MLGFSRSSLPHHFALAPRQRSMGTEIQCLLDHSSRRRRVQCAGQRGLSLAPHGVMSWDTFLLPGAYDLGGGLVKQEWILLQALCFLCDEVRGI